MELGSLLEEDPPYGHTPEPHQVSTFETEWKRTGEGTKACDATPADFMIDFEGPPKSPWNVSAGRVFTDHLIQRMGYNDTRAMRKKIEKAFTTRIKSLKSSRKEKRLPAAERAFNRSKHARQQRKDNVL
jgi:plasmid maintenance system killer protein